MAKLNMVTNVHMKMCSVLPFCHFDTIWLCLFVSFAIIEEITFASKLPSGYSKMQTTLYNALEQGVEFAKENVAQDGFLL